MDMDDAVVVKVYTVYPVTEYSYEIVREHDEEDEPLFRVWQSTAPLMGNYLFDARTLPEAMHWLADYISGGEE